MDQKIVDASAARDFSLIHVRQVTTATPWLDLLGVGRASLRAIGSAILIGVTLRGWTAARGARARLDQDSVYHLRIAARDP
jgi:hypothetical protein